MFAKRLKELRKKTNLTQTQFAKDFNISTGTIGMWETKQRTPDIDMLSKIADYFGVTVDYLLGKEEQNKKELSAESEELIEKLLNSPSDKAVVVMFGGDGPKVVEIPQEKADLAARLLGTLNEKDG